MGLLIPAIAIVSSIAALGLIIPSALADTGTSPDIWTLLEKGGAPMAGILFLALVEVGRRHDRAYKIIEIKDATILELSTRQIGAIETANDIAKDQITIARNTEKLLAELVTLGRGKPAASSASS